MTVPAVPTVPTGSAASTTDHQAEGTSTPQAPAVEIVGVHKSFGDVEVLRGVDLTIRRGTVTVILGPSGSGKSTLLRTINHLEKPDSGLVLVDGEPIGVRRSGNRLKQLPESRVLRQRARIGFVFQSFNLFPHLTVLDNVVEAPLALRTKPPAEVRRAALELLDLVGLADKADVHPRQLSGGQQQRVAIARALALDPSLILFDEPTSALDPELVGEVLSAIKDLAATGTTLIAVTHEIGFAREVADRVIFVDHGVVVEDGTPEAVIDNPSNPRTREFLAKVL